MHVLWLKLLNFLILFIHVLSDICTDSALTNALNTDTSHATLNQPTWLPTQSDLCSVYM